MSLGLGLGLHLGSAASQQRKSPQQTAVHAIKTRRAVHAFPKGSSAPIELEPYSLYSLIEAGPVFLDAIQIPADQINPESPGFTTFEFSVFSKIVQLGRTFFPHQAYRHLLPRLGGHVISCINFTQLAGNAESQTDKVVFSDEAKSASDTEASNNIDPKDN